MARWEGDGADSDDDDDDGDCGCVLLEPVTRLHFTPLTDFGHTDDL